MAIGSEKCDVSPSDHQLELTFDSRGKQSVAGSNIAYLENSMHEREQECPAPAIIGDGYQGAAG